MLYLLHVFMQCGSSGEKFLLKKSVPVTLLISCSRDYDDTPTEWHLEPVRFLTEPTEDIHLELLVSFSLRPLAPFPPSFPPLSYQPPSFQTQS
jgi:hypothetical protein